MHIWTIPDWEKYYDFDKRKYRSGLRLVCDSGIDSEVRRACKDFFKWLRTEYYFPIRVPVYVKHTHKIMARDGELVSATFLGPFDRDVEPYIRVAVGDYQDILKNRGKDNALASILGSIAHELTHYFQWVNNINLTEFGYERQATKYAKYILEEYADTREHP
ncbi:MAG: tetratricopeptide repeat protein [Bacillales bacterium]|jgi:hypothetical protein|nr:tetratricopeptide repeat protein [Bacillales bacterium]